MLLNPVVESDDENPASEDPRDWMVEGLRHPPTKIDGTTDFKMVANTPNSQTNSDMCAEQLSASPVDDGCLPDGTPRLELSISESELDQLLKELPPDAGMRAGEKPPRGASEMQWVLAFLTNPDGAEPVDAETKHLMASMDLRDDDNFQEFLKDMTDANLMNSPSPSKPTQPPIDADKASSGRRSVGDFAACTREAPWPPTDLFAIDEQERLVSDDEDDSDWTATRRQLKQRGRHER